MISVFTSNLIGMKAQSDCCYELLEILPSLKPGVFVHVHDIFTPFDYPAEWLLDDLRPFNEQYALQCLQCLLTLNTAFEIILPVYFLYRTQRNELTAPAWRRLSASVILDAEDRLMTPEYHTSHETGLSHQ